jgi:hypothetical protein
MMEIKCKRKIQKETNMSGRRDKKSSALGWKIGTCVSKVRQKFSVYGKNGDRRRDGERIKEREK